MDLDDIFPTPKSDGSTIGEDLSQLSVSELEERIIALREEITRVEAEKATRKNVRSAAEDVFKS